MIIIVEGAFDTCISTYVQAAWRAHRVLEEARREERNYFAHEYGESTRWPQSAPFSSLYMSMVALDQQVGFYCPRA